MARPSHLFAAALVALAACTSPPGDEDASLRSDARVPPGADAGLDAAGFDAGPPDGLPPTASAGADVTITWPTTRTPLAGSQTGGVRFEWAQVSGPTASVLRDAAGLSPLATSLRVGTYVFRLTVTDNEALSASDDVTVTVAADPSRPDTAVAHVLAQTAPVFRRGHRLPPLGFGGFPHLEFNQRVAERYRFALHIGDPTDFWTDLARDYTGRPRDVIELAASDPETYRISINVLGYNGFYDCDRLRRMRLMDESIAMHHADGSLWAEGTDGCYAFNPAASREVWRALAMDTGLPANLATIEDVAEAHGARISVINDLGEYGLQYAAIGEARWSDDTWRMWMLSSAFWDDSYVRAAWGPMPPAPVPFDGGDYGRAIIERAYAGVSEGKGVQAGAVSELFVEATHPDVLYTLYLAGPAPHTGRFNEWGQVAWDHAALARHDVNHPRDVYSTGMYYGDNNEGGLGVRWTDAHPDGGRPADHFTHALAAAANAIAAGSPHAYVWISPRGRHASSFVDREEMMGFLKAYYCLAMIGGPFFYEFFDPYTDTDPATTGVATMPGWMETVIAMGEVHALYSHLDDLLLDGHVLPNAHGDAHPFRRWTEPFPLYEQYAYPVGAPFTGPRDATVRVVARVSASGDTWLVAGWAAEGEDREVDVELPEPLGRTTLRMRRAGSVYRLRREGGATVAELVDLDPLRPTDHMLESD